MAIRVLIADDDGFVRDALQALVASESRLNLAGVASDAEEAVELARRLRPDIALIDLKMPGGGGLRAAREITECSPETRLLAMSAHDDRASVTRMLHAGAVGYIVKGATVAEIVDAITRSCRGEAVLPPVMMGDVA